MTNNTCPICGNDTFSKVFDCKDHFVSGETFEIVECEKCKMRITKDFPAENEIGKYYETSDYISHSDTKKGAVNAVYHRVRKLMLRKKAGWIEENTGLRSGKLLDVGTGTGYFAAEMKARGWDVSVVEKNDSARRFAEKNFQLTAFPSIDDFVKKHAPEHPETFDVITLWHVLEHIENLNDTAYQLVTLLKTGGKLVIAVPNCNSYDALKYGNLWAAYDVPRHLWHFRKEQIEILAGIHGLYMTDVKKMPFDAFYISMMSEKYSRKKFPFIRGMMSGSGGLFSSFSDVTKSSSLVYFLEKE